MTNENQPSTAVIFSGQMRTFTTCAPLFKWQVLRHYPRADIFISTTQDEDTAPAIALAHELFTGNRLHIAIEPSQPDFPEPHADHCPPPFDNSVPLPWILRQWWQHQRAWKLYEAKRTHEHATIIRARADSFFHEFTKPDQPYPHTAYTPWWGRFGGCNDRFAIMGQDAARAYFNISDNLNALLAAGCPFHPETLTYANLEYCGATIHDTLNASFSTLRKDGKMRLPEVSANDVVNATNRRFS